jgi:hypothetical protein
MKAPLSTILTTHALRIATFTAMLLGLVVTAPLYGQDSERERMNALHKTISASNPAPLEHSERSILAVGTELLSDGGFEGGYYGGSSTIDTSGVTGPWTWNNNPSWLTPIWQNSGSTNARTGNFMVYFNPFGPAQSQIAQKVTFPSNVTATLSFWLKLSGAAGGNPADVLGVNFCDSTGAAINTFVRNYSDTDAAGYSWVNYSYDVSSFAGQTVYLLFWTHLTGNTIFMLDDISILTYPTAPPPSATCTEDALTMCLGGGRYRVTSHWKNQYVGDTVTTPMQKTDLTDIVGAFWKDAGAYQFFVSVNPATAALNGHTWVAINTFSGVEFWVDVTDTVNGQYKEYHNTPENKTLVEDRTFFVYP